MSLPIIFLGAVVVLPIIVLMLLRINAAVVFMSLCLGDVLVQFVAGNTSSLMRLFKPSHSLASVTQSGNDVRIFLLFLPVVLTAVFMIRTVRGARWAINVLPAAGVGLLASLLLVPLLSPGMSHTIMHSAFWRELERLQDLIVGLSSVVCLVVLWLQRPKSGGEGKTGKHHA